MQHKISYLAKSNPEKLPEQVKTRFLAGDKNPFAMHLRHLDPRPSTARSLTRERSSTPHPPNPNPEEPPRAEPDPLATAVAQACIELFTDSSDNPPFQGFGTGRASPDYHAHRDSPPHHRHNERRHERQSSRSSSPEPPRKMARRTSSPGPHRSSGPRRPRSRTPRRSQSPDPCGRSPNRPPSWDQVCSMIKESETRMSSALDRMAQTLETFVTQRASPHEPPRAHAFQDYHPTPRVRDYEEEEYHDQEEEAQATMQKPASKLRLGRKRRKVSMATPMTPLGTSTTPSTPISRFRRSSRTISFSFRMRPSFTMITLTSSGSS